MLDIFKRKGKATPELVAVRMMEKPTRTTVQWPDGTTTTRIIDWTNRKAVHRFGTLANRAIRAGGQSKTEAVHA